MEKVIKVNNLEETIALGNRLGLLLQPNMLLTLSGDLGAGKTDLYQRNWSRIRDYQGLLIVLLLPF